MSKIISFLFFVSAMIALYVIAPTYEFPASITASNRIDKRLLTLFARYEVGGAYLISQNSEVKFEKYAGYENYFHKTTLNKDSLFSLGTLSQQYTGHLYYNLIDKEVINPDHKVDLFIRELDQRFIGEQTIRDLLTMKPRNPYHFKRGRILKWQLGIEPTREELMKQINEITPAHFCPEIVQKGCYSQLSYTALAMVLENFTKKKWNQIFKEKFIDKYDLKETYFNLQGTKDIVRGHYPFTKTKMSPIPVWNHNYSLGNSGVRASLRDFHKFQLAISEQINGMKEPKKYFDQSQFLYGWHKEIVDGETLFWSRGDDFGFYNLVVRVPDRNLIAIFLFNIDSNLREGFHEELFKIFLTMIPKF